MPSFFFHIFFFFKGQTVNNKNIKNSLINIIECILYIYLCMYVCVCVYIEREM